MMRKEFWHFKSKYIYLLKSFGEGEQLEGDEMEIQEEELNNFLQDLKVNLDNYTYKDYKVVLVESNEWKNDEINVFGKIIIKGYNVKFTIELLIASGLHWGVSVDYDYDGDLLEDYKRDRDFVRVFNYVIRILEHTLFRHFDKAIIEKRDGEYYKRF